LAPGSLCNLNKQYAGGTVVAGDRLNRDDAAGAFLDGWACASSTGVRRRRDAPAIRRRPYRQRTHGLTAQAAALQGTEIA
jgi:hypothetical protein